MANNAIEKPGSGERTEVRVVVVGDHGTGKSSLILTAAGETLPHQVPPVLPPICLPADYYPYYPDRVPVIIIDTSSSLENRNKVSRELRLADAVVLTYACDQPGTLDRLSTFWLPELRRLEVTVPVIVVGCKMDAREDTQASLKMVMPPTIQQCQEIETCIECSALNRDMITEVFYYALRAVIHPTAPLVDPETWTLKPRCVRALKRIFIFFDHDKDGTLSDAELNDFQLKCFNAPVEQSDIIGVKKVVQQKLPEGVNNRGLSLTGFLFLHKLFIEKDSRETTWMVLRKFGYDNEIKLRDDLLPVTLKRAPDQSVELSSEAVDFLKGIFCLFDLDADGALQPADLDDLFSTAPGSPWNDAPYKNAAEGTIVGGLSLGGFLSLWALMTLLEPAKTVANLIYIGYRGDPTKILCITKKRRLDRKKQQSEKNVFQCFVFGPKNAGKTALLNSFLGRSFHESYTSTNNERFEASIVEQIGETKKTLVLREIPEDGVKNVLSSKQSLAACDVAIFVYDTSDERSWKRARELLVDVVNHGENSGFEVPCLLITAKDDLDPNPIAVQDSTRISQDMGIEAPIGISMKLGDLNNVFCKIINAAERPHLSIPQTEAGKKRKQYRVLVNRSLMFVSVGAAVAVAGLAAFRVYAARKNNSG